jgi:hypothetical protein
MKFIIHDDGPDASLHINNKIKRKTKKQEIQKKPMEYRKCTMTNHMDGCNGRVLLCAWTSTVNAVIYLI